MRWLVRLAVPPGGLVLDPCAGSGTTGEAVVLEGARCILIEQDPAYVRLIIQRLSGTRRPGAQG
jgi:DNA modification methylase